MADFTASTAVRDAMAKAMASTDAGTGLGAGQQYYWATLHDATGGFVATDVYAAGIRGELATLGGYTRGTKQITGVIATSASPATVAIPDVIWTQDGSGNAIAATYAAIWCAATNSITGAKLVCVKNSAQTASGGGTMKLNAGTIISVPTPA